MPTKNRPATQYGYAVARLRALENRLLDETTFQRMIDCDTLESAVKVLGETPYSSWLMEQKSAGFDKAIEAALHAAYVEVAGFVPETDIVSLLRLPYDVHNVKTLLKSLQHGAGIPGSIYIHTVDRLYSGRVVIQNDDFPLHAAERGGKRRLDLLTSLGNVDTDTLTLAVEGEDYTGLPFGLDKAIPAAVELWQKDQDALALEKFLDGYYFKALLKTAEGLAMPEVVRWVKARIDGENLKTLLRLTHIPETRAQTATFLHAGGTLPPATLAPLVMEGPENWGRLLSYAGISKLLTAFTEDGDFSSMLVQFEKNLDNYVTETIAPARYSTFEPANVVRYLWLKEIEAKNLRIVLVSVANGVEKEAIRGLLRDVR